VAGGSSPLDDDVVRPGFVLGGPGGTVVGAFEVGVRASEVVFGLGVGGFEVGNGRVLGVSGSGRDFVVVVEPVVLGEVVSVRVVEGAARDAAGNLSVGSEVLTVLAGSPASEFEARKDDIRRDVQSEVLAQLGHRLQLNADVLLGSMEDAGGRGGVGGDEGSVWDGDWFAEYENGLWASAGEFEASFVSSEVDGGSPDLAWDVQGSYALESQGAQGVAVRADQMALLSRRVDGGRVGGFVGVGLEDAWFEGEPSGLLSTQGLRVGTVGWREVWGGLQVGGFVGVGLNRHALDVDHGPLRVTSAFGSWEGSVGATVRGAVEEGSHRLAPSLRVSAGRLTVGRAAVTAEAYGLTDDSLALDVGSVSQVGVEFAPSYRLGLAGVGLPDVQVRVDPSVACDVVSEGGASVGMCRSGADVGVRRVGEGGLVTSDVGVGWSRSGDRSALDVSFEWAFPY
jgi:hypothetical protein